LDQKLDKQIFNQTSDNPLTNKESVEFQTGDTVQQYPQIQLDSSVVSFDEELHGELGELMRCNSNTSSSNTKDSINLQDYFDIA